MADVRVPSLDRLLPPEETTLGYLLRLSRPRFWLYLAGPVVVGVAYAAETPAELFSPLALALFAYFLLPANVYLYGVNDIFDADIDEANPKKDDKEVRFEGGAAVILVIFACGALGIVLAPFVGMGFVPLGLYYLLATEYSAPPLRFKTTPILDSLSNGLYALPGVVAFSAIADTYPPLAAIAGAWLWTMAMHTYSAIPDIEPDREAGIQTTATLLGPGLAAAYCGVAWLLAAGVFALVDLRLGLLFLAYPTLLAVFELADVDVDRAYWWYPAVNTLAGMAFTLGGLWGLLYA